MQIKEEYDPRLDINVQIKTLKGGLGKNAVSYKINSNFKNKLGRKSTYINLRGSRLFDGTFANIYGSTNKIINELSDSVKIQETKEENRKSHHILPKVYLNFAEEYQNDPLGNEHENIVSRSVNNNESKKSQNSINPNEHSIQRI